MFHEIFEPRQISVNMSWTEVATEMLVSPFDFEDSACRI